MWYIVRIACLFLLSITAIHTVAYAQQTTVVEQVTAYQNTDSEVVILDIKNAGNFALIQLRAGLSREIWRTDGTSQGTQFLRRFPVSERVRLLSAGNGKAYYQTFRYKPGQFNPLTPIDQQLWVTDGSASNTMKLAAKGYTPNGATVMLDDQLVYQSDTALWISNGTESGTQQLADFASNNSAMRLTHFEQRIIFSAETQVAGQTKKALWRSDGTRSGTEVIRDGNGQLLECGNLLPATLPGQLIFPCGNQRVLRLTTQGITQIYPDPTAPLPALARFSSPRMIGTYDDTVIFTALGSLSSSTTNNGIWRSDGTFGRTGRFAELSSSSRLFRQGVSAVNLFFAKTQDDGPGSDASLRPQLLRIDSSDDSTFVLPSVGPVGSSLLATAQGIVYRQLTAQSTNAVAQLWRSNGTEAGTSVLAQMSSWANPVLHNSLVLFPGADDKSLWRTDGSESGTEKVFEFTASRQGFNPKNFTQVGTHFYATNNFGDPLFYIPDAGAFAQQQATGLRDITLSKSHQGELYLAGTDNHGSSGSQDNLLVRINSGVATTVAVGKTVNRLRNSVSINGYLLANITDSDRPDGRNIGREPYLIDRNGASLLKDIKTYQRYFDVGSDPGEFVRLNSQTVLFTADELRPPSNAATIRGFGWELWRTDGTRSGTRLVKDINRGSYISNDTGENPQRALVPRSSIPSQLTRVAGRIYFSAVDSRYGRELWRSDGTSQGTRLVKDINVSGNTQFGEFVALGNRLIFSANDGRHGLELWASDGRTIGTALVKDIFQGSRSSSPKNFLVIGDRLFFSADDGKSGRELWVTQGTATSTRRVADINPGALGSSPSHLVAFNDTAYFVADDGSHGKEIWRSRGTKRSTTLVVDLWEGAFGAAPSNLMTAQGALYFSADNGINGTQIHRIKSGLSRDTAWYAERPAAIDACLAEHPTGIDLGFITIASEAADDDIDSTRLNGLSNGDIDTDTSTARQFALGLLNADRREYVNGTKRGTLIRQCFVAARNLLVAQCNATWLGADTFGFIDIADSVASLAAYCRPQSNNANRLAAGQLVLKHNLRAKKFNLSHSGSAWPFTLGQEPEAQPLTNTDWDDPTDKND